MAQTILALDQYFERDIIEFLDKKKELQDAEAKNTSSEMISALESSNIALAQKILEDAIFDYNKIGLHDVYKEIYFKKILEMTRQAIDFLNIHPQQSKLRETVELLIKSGELSQGTVEKITALEEKINQEEEEKINAIAQEKDYANHLLEKIKNVSNKIVLSIRKKDIRTAVISYKELKLYFEQYPSTDMDKKQDIYNDLLSFFMQINKLKKEVGEEKEKAIEDKKRLERATRANTNKYLRLTELNEIISKIKEDVKNSDFTAATQKIIELRQITGRIPDQYKHIRSILNSKIDVIVQRVEFVKRLKTHN